MLENNQTTATRPTKLNVVPPAAVAAPGFIILAAQPPRLPALSDLGAPGLLSAYLTHDAGVTWPDRRGEQVMQAVLAEGGTAALLFENLADASAGFERLVGGRS